MNFAELFGRSVVQPVRDWIVDGTFDRTVYLVAGDCWNSVSNMIASELWDLIMNLVCYAIVDAAMTVVLTHEFR